MDCGSGPFRKNGLFVTGEILHVDGGQVRLAPLRFSVRP
jgi:hypothetical protein